MNKFKNISLAACVALLSFTSCNDFLDTTPDTRVYLSTVDQLRQLLITGYSSTSYTTVCELSTDNVVDNNSPSADDTRENLPSFSPADDQLFAFEDVTMSIDNDSPSGVWNGCYGAIATANAVLEKAEEFEQKGADANGALSADAKARLDAVKGEAYMIRAYHYFLLSNVFCLPYRGPELSKTIDGIPYITKPETVVNPKYERGNLADVYANIEKDLEMGLKLVSDDFYDSPKYHFNKAAANAFAARFYLFKRDYPKVVEHATAAFKGNDPATICSDVWSKTDFFYVSDIGRYFTSSERTNNMLIMSYYTSWWRRLVMSPRYACNRDAKRATIQGPGPSWEGFTFTNNKTKEQFSMNPCFVSLCGSSGSSDYGVYFAPNAFEQFEYTDKLAGIGYVHGVRAEFTTEETLLCRAEAYLFMGEIDKAMEDLKTFDGAMQKNANSTPDRYRPMTRELVERFYSLEGSKRTGGRAHGIMKPIHIDQVCPNAQYRVTDEILPYLQCVQHFRRIWTVHTGQRWFDIRRFGLSVTHNIGVKGSKTIGVTAVGDDWFIDARYAIQIPTEIQAAGMKPTPREPLKLTNLPEQRVSKDVVPADDVK